jgi:signal transduction histidine kinase
VGRHLLRDTGYLLLALPYGVVASSLVVTGLALGVGTAVMWVGVPVLAATLTVAHWLARLDVARLTAAGRDPRPTANLEPAPLAQPALSESLAPGKAAGLRWLGRLVAPLRNPQRWRETAHALLALPLGLLTWTLTISLWSLAVGGLTAWAWEPIIDRLAEPVPGAYADSTGPADLLGWPVPNWLLELAIGLVAAVALPPVSRGLTAAHRAEARLTLMPSDAELARRVAQLERSRAQASAAETQSLRKIERDIHDGPQQRLVRLSMDLASAHRRLKSGDAAAAEQLLIEARATAGDAIAELRALSRGISPPILQDRGLAAALSALAAGAGLPVRLVVQPSDPPRLPAALETALYFAASELLANVAKHSGAASAEVLLRVEAETGEIELTVSDDGRGGAVPVPGHGLAGLADRLAGVDGSLTVGPGADGRGTAAVAKAPLKLGCPNPDLI